MTATPSDLSGVTRAKSYTTLADKMLKAEVLKARSDGASWNAIALALGVTAQAARQRFRKFETSNDLDAKHADGSESTPNGPEHAADHLGRVNGHSSTGSGQHWDRFP